MDRLSSCYFCGDAFDASLDEYPVVPSALTETTDAPQTVVLCRGCHRKLDSIRETVVEAVERDADGQADSHHSNVGAVDSPSGESVESTLDDGEDLLQSVSDDHGDGGDDSPDAVDTTDDAADTTDDAADTTDPDTLETDGERSSPGEESVEPDTSETVTTRADTPKTDTTGTDASEADPAETNAPETDTDGPSLTRLEYSKVMRLLQNREFPVRRQGFVNVAANAYEISHEECEQILDVAIEHGLIDEEDGQLVRGEEG